MQKKYKMKVLSLGTWPTEGPGFQLAVDAWRAFTAGLERLAQEDVPANDDRVTQLVAAAQQAARQVRVDPHPHPTPQPPSETIQPTASPPQAYPQPTLSLPSAYLLTAHCQPSPGLLSAYSQPTLSLPYPQPQPYPIPSDPTRSHALKPRLIRSHVIPCDPIQSHPIPSDPIRSPRRSQRWSTLARWPPASRQQGSCRGSQW